MSRYLRARERSLELNFLILSERARKCYSQICYSEMLFSDFMRGSPVLLHSACSGERREAHLGGGGVGRCPSELFLRICKGGSEGGMQPLIP